MSDVSRLRIMGWHSEIVGQLTKVDVEVAKMSDYYHKKSRHRSYRIRTCYLLVINLYAIRGQRKRKRLISEAGCFASCESFLEEMTWVLKGGVA
jgi:hypothetical protein